MDRTVQILVLVSIAFDATMCQGGGWGMDMGGGGGGLDILGHGTSIFDMLFGLLGEGPPPQTAPPPPAMGMGGPGGMGMNMNMLQTPVAPPMSPNALNFAGMSGMQGGGLRTGMTGGLSGGMPGGMMSGGGMGLTGQEMLLAKLLSSSKGGSGAGGGGEEGGAGGGGEGGAGGEEGGAGGGTASGMPSMMKDLMRLSLMQQQSQQFPRNRATGGMNMGGMSGMRGGMNMRGGMGQMGQMGAGMGGGMSMRDLGTRLAMQRLLAGKSGRGGGGGGEGGEGGAAGGAGGEGGAGGGEGGGAAGGAGGEGGAGGGGGEGGGRSGMEWAMMAMKNPQFRKMSGNLLKDFTGSIFRMIDGTARTMGLPLGAGGRGQNTRPSMAPPRNGAYYRGFGQQAGGAMNNPFSGPMGGQTKMSGNDFRSFMMKNEQAKNGAMPGGVNSQSFQTAWAAMRKNGQVPTMGSKTTWQADWAANAINGRAPGTCPDFPYVVKGGKVVFQDINLNCQLSVNIDSTASPPMGGATGSTPSPPTTTPAGAAGMAPNNASPLAQMQNKMGGDTVATCPPWKVWRRDREIHIETIPDQCHIIVMSMKGIPGIQGSNSVQVRFASRSGQTPRPA